MDQQGHAQFPIHELLARRWSPRAFDERLVEADILRTLFEAARWAPSSNNEQPWRFIVATKDHETEWNRLVACLAEGNQKWAIRAPVLILSVASMNFEADGKPNRHAFHDTGRRRISSYKRRRRLVAHQMAGFNVEKARIDLRIPTGCEPVAMIAVGYPGDPAVLPERLRGRELRPRIRRPIGEWTFSGQWGAPIH